MCCGNIFGGSFFDSFISLFILSNRGNAAGFGNQDYEKSAKRKCEKIIFLFKLGKFKDILKYICLSFISFLPLFYFCYIYYFGSLIFCCQFVARFIITGSDKFDNIQFENSAYLSLFYKIISTRIILTFIIRIIDIFFRIIQKCFFFNKSNI